MRDRFDDQHAARLERAWGWVPRILVGVLGVLGLGAAGCGSSPKATTAQCVLNSDCSGALVCAQGYCVAACVTSRDCAGDSRCIILPGLGNVCQPPEKQTCAYNSQCSPLVCGADLECRNQCVTDVDCPSGQKCTSISMLCVDPLKDGPGHYDPATNELIPAPDAGAKDAGSSGQAGAAGGGGKGGGAGAGTASGAGTAGAGGSAGKGAAGGAAGANATGGAGGGSSDGGIASAWRLWVTDPNARHVYGYGAAHFQKLSGDAPDTDLALPSVMNGHSYYLRTIAFDPQGTLWAYLECGCAGDQVWAVGQSQTSVSGPVTAVASALFIPPTALTGGNFNPVGPWISFDVTGNLWWQTKAMSNNNGIYELLRLDASAVASLTTTATMPAATFLSTYSMQGSIILDDVGDVYSYFTGASNEVLARFDAAQLVGNGSSGAPPAMTITVGATQTPSALVLTPSGQIIIAVGADLYRYSKQQVAQTGTNLTTTPESHFTLTGLTSGFLPLFLALDPDGNLYLTSGMGSPLNQIFKVAASDLAQTGTATIPAGPIVRPSTGNPSAVFAQVVIR